MLCLLMLFMAEITLDSGLQLHYQDEGRGAPVLLITGMGVRLNTWDAVAAGLDDHFRVIRLDNRGMGGSGDLAGPYTVATMAEDAADLMAALDIENYHLVGISLGSFAAQSLALQFPERVRSLTLIGSSLGGAVHVAPDAEVLAYFQSMLTLTAEQRAQQGLALSLHPKWMAEHADQLAEMQAAAAAYTPPPAVVMRQIMAAMAFDHSEKATEITVPTLVIHGAQDRVVPTANGQLVAETIPKAQLEIIANSGHLTIIDASDQVVALLKQFFKAH